MMNSDLLIGKYGQCGLLCDHSFAAAPIGAIFDAQTRSLILEFEGNRDPLHLNITVEERFGEKILTDRSAYVIALEAGEIVQALEIPLMYLNDPYGGGFDRLPAIKPHASVIGAEQFLKRSTFAQPIHRDDLGDESTLNGILGGEDVRGLAFAPHLARQREFEKMPHYVAAPAAQLSLGGGSRTLRTKDASDSSDY